MLKSGESSFVDKGRFALPLDLQPAAEATKMKDYLCRAGHVSV